MLLAVHAMSADAQVICYGIAIAGFILAGISGFTARHTPALALVGLGLAAYAFPVFWNTLAIS